MPDFQSRPLLDARPDFDKLTHAQLDDHTLRRSGIGAATPWKATTKLKRTFKLPFLFTTKAEWRAFRDFVAARRGTLQGFWVPCWVTDYESTLHFGFGDPPLVPFTYSQLRIKPIGLVDVFVANEQFAFGALITPTRFEPFEIDSVTLASGTERLGLVAPWPSDATGQELTIKNTICCPMIYGRFDEGKIDYEFISDGVVRCEVGFVELPREYVTSITTSRPILLFEFKRGAFTWRATNYAESVIVGGELWCADNITSGSMSYGLEFLSESTEVEVRTDRTDHPLRYYLTRNALEKTTLSIFESDAATLTYDSTKPIYAGDIDTVEFQDEGGISANLTSILRVNEIQSPRMQVQRLCNNRTYDENCGAIEADFTTAGFVSVIGADYIEATEFGTKAAAMSDPNWFALGKVKVGTETRLCTGQNGDRLYLDAPFLGASVLGAISAVAGDDKRVGTCVGKFNRLVSHLGFSALPARNPQFEALSIPKAGGGKKS